MKPKGELYCSICGRKLDKKYKHNMCAKHYEEYMTYGFCITDNQRDKDDPNMLYRHDGYVEMFLYDNMQEEIEQTAILDLDDYDKVRGIRFDLERGYITTKINDNKTLLENYIMDTNDKVEFINGDKFDFRKENLRVIKKEIKTKKNPYVVSKKNKNKIIIEFIGNSKNGVVGSCVLISYPVGNGKYEKIMIENGMTQKNGALKDEYIINKEVMSAVMSIGEIEGLFLSHAHL